MELASTTGLPLVLASDTSPLPPSACCSGFCSNIASRSRDSATGCIVKHIHVLLARVQAHPCPHFRPKAWHAPAHTSARGPSSPPKTKRTRSQLGARQDTTFALYTCMYVCMYVHTYICNTSQISNTFLLLLWLAPPAEPAATGVTGGVKSCWSPLKIPDKSGAGALVPAPALSSSFPAPCLRFFPMPGWPCTVRV